MTAEFMAAADICQRFLRQPTAQPYPWPALFSPVPFFSQHTFYIQVGAQRLLARYR
jgi:poly(A) polymerase